MRHFTIIILFLTSCPSYSQDLALGSEGETSPQKNFTSSINVSLLSVGYSWNHSLSEEFSLGNSVSYGFDYGFFLPIEGRYRSDARKGMLSLFTIDLSLTQRVSKSLHLEYGILYTVSINDVPLLDGATVGNHFGPYINPWWGNRVKVGFRLAFSKAHIDGGDYPSYDSWGFYTSLLRIQISL